ncbi:MAG: hypothetical protein AB7T38_02610 [Nitrospirales bacterium]
MRTIWKYMVPATDVFSLDLPEGAVFLSLHVQQGHPRMWFLVDPEKPRDGRIFSVVGTGHDFPYAGDDFRFLGTFLVGDGVLVFHVFERRGDA